MKKRKWLAACLAAAVAVALLGGPPARAEERPPGGYSYRYVLERSGEQPGGNTFTTRFHLFVQSSDPAAPALHTGSIALWGRMELSLAMEGSYTALGFEGESTPENQAADGGSVLGFTWYAREGKQPELDEQGRQFLGSVSVGYGSGKADPSEVKLRSYYETAAGRDQIDRLLAATDPLEQENLRELVGGVWRMESGEAPRLGFYQGYYAQESTEGETQVAVDIGNGWQSFSVIAYDPKVGLTLTAVAADGAETSLTLPGLAAGVGKSIQEIDLSGFSGLSPGEYRLRVEKRSHVTATYAGLTVAGESLFPELLGETLTLPCGDVNGDGAVRQTDRALLTAPGRYGLPAAEETAVYDLDGDGHIGQRDLAILTDPANYGKRDFTVSRGGGGG